LEKGDEIAPEGPTPLRPDYLDASETAQKRDEYFERLVFIEGC
jgi:hypothetical protein